MQHFSKFTKQHVKLIPTNNAVQKFFHIQIISGIHSICAKQERCEIKCKSHRALIKMTMKHNYHSVSNSPVQFTPTITSITFSQLAAQWKTLTKLSNTNNRSI